MERTYPADLATKSEDQIADELVQEARDGRFGAFGEIGQNPNGPLSLDERKAFRAIGKAHVRTGLPIFTHNSWTGRARTSREISACNSSIFWNRLASSPST